MAPHSGDPAGLIRLPRVRLVGGASGALSGADFEVKEARRSGKRFAVFLLAGIDSAQEAVRWSGAAVLARRKDLPRLAEGEYYVADLVGCEVAANGETIGVVTGVTPGPAHDWLAIRRRDGETFLPLVERFVRGVDLAARRIVVDPPAGW